MRRRRRDENVFDMRRDDEIGYDLLRHRTKSILMVDLKLRSGPVPEKTSLYCGKRSGQLL